MATMGRQTSDQCPESFIAQASSQPVCTNFDAQRQRSATHSDITTPSRARWWKMLPIDLLKIGGLLLVVPSLTNVKTDFFHGDTSKAALVQSVVDSSKAAFTLLVVVQLGQLSDVVGRRPLIALSVLSSLMSLGTLALFPDNMYYYFVMYALAGLLGGQMAPASQAYVADCTSQEDRARILGLRGAFVSAVVMSMPALSTLVEYHYGRQELAIIAAGMQVAALAALCILPESLPKDNRQPFVASIGCSHLVQTLRQLLQRRGLLLWDLSILQFLRGLTTGIPGLFAFKALLDLTDQDFSILITIIGGGGIITQSLIMGWMTRCGCSQLTMIVFGIAVDACCFFAYGLLDMFPMKVILYSVSACHCLSRVYIPAITALATKGVDSDKGFVLGAFGAIDNITSIASPLLMAFLYQISPVVPFFLASSLNLVCFPLAFKLRARVSQAEAENHPNSLLGTECASFEHGSAPTTNKSVPTSGARLKV